MLLSAQKSTQVTFFLQAHSIGADLMVSITAGQAHIGAVALATPRPSLSQPQTTSADAHVLTLSGHKEDLLARAAALKLCAAMGVPVCLSCGIHISHFQPQHESIITETVLGFVDDLLALLRHSTAQEHYTCTRSITLPIQEHHSYD